MTMNNNLLEALINNGRKVIIVSLCVFTFTFAWTNLFLLGNNTAHAETINVKNLPFVVAVDSIIPDGTGDKIQGKAKEDIGTVQKNLGNTEGQVKGTLKQVEGKAQQDIGEVKGRLDKAGDNLEDASESFADSVKSFFGQ